MSSKIIKILLSKNKKNLMISLIESLYLIYMFYFFKTTFDFNIFSSPKYWAFKHLKGRKYGLRICLFGKIIIVPFIFILILRNYIRFPNYFMKSILFLSFVLSWMNMNAVAYFVPIWLIELLIINKKNIFLKNNLKLLI